MARVNECGHPERKHAARGMCWACYQNRPEYAAVRKERARADYLRKKEDPEWYSAMLDRGRTYHQVHRDRLLVALKHYKSDPERKAHFAAYQRDYRAKQARRPRLERPEYDCLAGARNANNRSRRLGDRGRITTAEVRQVMSSGVCAECGTDEQPSLDHIQPLSRGGLNVKGNLQRLCLPCNSRKRDALVGVAA